MSKIRHSREGGSPVKLKCANGAHYNDWMPGHARNGGICVTLTLN